MRYLAAGVVIFFLVCGTGLSVQQRDDRYRNDIAELQARETFEEQENIVRELMANEQHLKNELAKQFNVTKRYGTDQNIKILIDAYVNEVGTSESFAESVQQAFLTVAYPFVYHGVFEEDAQQAMDAYHMLFEERVPRKWDPFFTRSSDQDSDTESEGPQGNVHIVNKTIQVETFYNNTIAEVTIEEEYVNQSSWRDEEVVYEFSLPQEAVMTGMQLGPDLELGSDAAERPGVLPSRPAPSPSPGSRQDGEEESAPPLPSPVVSEPVSPSPATPGDNALVEARGAAQQTYEEQVRRVVDPSILEQVGPRQYRLRIFPIERKEYDRASKKYIEGERQKIRFSYVVATRPDGYALPAISSSESVQDSEYLMPEYTVNGREAKLAISTLGPVLQPKGSEESEPVVDFCNAPTLVTEVEGNSLYFVPHSSRDAFIDDQCRIEDEIIAQNIQNRRIAVLYDVSYSHKQYHEENKDSITQEYELLSLLNQANDLDFYHFNTLISESRDLPANLEQFEEITFYGKTDRYKALNTIPDAYDMILMITDDSTIEEQETDEPLPFSAPLYVVHHGEVPQYQLPLSDALLSKQVSLHTSVEEALQVYAFSVLSPVEGRLVEVSPYWRMILGEDQAVLYPQSQFVEGTRDPFVLLASRQYTEFQIQQADGTPEELDSLNRLAQEFGIVTPYSSMIVLINDEQRERLRELSGQDDRFVLEDRASADEQAVLDQQLGFSSQFGAVPEPGEWLLIFTAAGLGVFLYRRQIQSLLYHVRRGNRHE